MWSEPPALAGGHLFNARPPDRAQGANDRAAWPREAFRNMDWLILKLRYASLISIALFVCLPVWAQEKSTPSSTPSKTSTSEVRALWVVRTTLTSIPKIQAMVKAAAENGFNTLIVQVRGRGDAFYRSRREPRAAEL